MQVHAVGCERPPRPMEITPPRRPREAVGADIALDLVRIFPALRELDRRRALVIVVDGLPCNSFEVVLGSYRRQSAA